MLNYRTLSIDKPFLAVEIDTLSQVDSGGRLAGECAVRSMHCLVVPLRGQRVPGHFLVLGRCGFFFSC